jgi:hypothetical protein
MPSEHVRGPVAAEITKTLATERDDATQRLNAAMRTRRYQQLVQLLRAWKAAPPFTDAAAGKEKTAVKYVAAAKHKADKRLRTAHDDFERLHQARKADKRLRYAAELAEPTDGRMKASPVTPRICRPCSANTRMPWSPPTSCPRLVLHPTERTAPAASPSGVLVADELNRAANIRKSLRC